MAKKQLIRLTESDLHKIVKESVKRTLKESSYIGDEYYQYEEIMERLNSSYDEYETAISELQQWYLTNVEKGSNMYNSYAGKYGDEAKHLLAQSYKRLGSMVEVEEEY